MNKTNNTESFNTIIREITRYKFISEKKKDYVYHYKVTYMNGDKQYYCHSTPIINRFIRNTKCIYSTIWKGKRISVYRINNSAR